MNDSEVIGYCREEGLVGFDGLGVVVCCDLGV